MKRLAMVGAGFSGAFIARELAKSAYIVDVYESRGHVAGNCYSERDPQTGVLVHVYGPHIFHTNDAKIWNFIRQFDEFVPFTNRVKAIARGRVYSLPINLLTINQFFGRIFTPAEAERLSPPLATGPLQIPRRSKNRLCALSGESCTKPFSKATR